jgi:hypothetical protein
MIIRQAQAAGVVLGQLQVVDAVHTKADVNVEKDRIRHEQGKPLADPDAMVVHKGKREAPRADLTTEKGDGMHRDFKTHAIHDPDMRMVPESSRC